VVKDGSWEEQLRRGGLELAIMLSLAPGSKYGLEIIKHLQATTDLVVAEGTIYPILARLTKEGLLAAAWTAEAGPHPRKYYRLTERGRRELRYMAGHWREFAHKMERLLEAAGGGSKE
jgi:PadR family transcriptional regulator PadR